MDIKTLKIGQKILLISAHFHYRARVLEITPTNVVVEGISDTTGAPEDKFRFDVNGRAVDSRDLGYKDTTCWDYITPGTYDGGAWEILTPGTYNARAWGLE